MYILHNIAPEHYVTLFMVNVKMIYYTDIKVSITTVVR